MEAEINKIVKCSLQKAIDNDKKGNVGQAYAYYTTVLELCPAKRKEFENSFIKILCEWGLYLETQNRMKDVIKIYKNALHIYPNNPIMLNNFAAHLLRYEDPVSALEYLTLALKINENYLPAVKNLQNAYSMSVDRWHFSMLNDKIRNQSFNEAIKKKIALGYDTVLDIGTGTGLLSLYAHKAKAKSIYACEYSQTMWKIANEVFLNNKVENAKLIPKASMDIKIPEDIPNRVKLIVTEIFDAALFGELVIPTLIDAHQKLLEGNGSGIIIPMSATLYVAAVECEYIRLRSSVNFEDSCYQEYFNLKNIVIISDEDYYDTENLENVNINYITEPMSILQLNFNDLDNLQWFSHDGIKETLTASCRYKGTIDGLVAWFKLNLDDDIVIDSSQGESCWQLAVFSSFPHNVSKNDIIDISAEIENGKLKCAYKVKNTTINIHEKLVYQLPREVIMFLNDIDYSNTLMDIAKSKKQENYKNIYDTCPFPIYGLTVLKENKRCETLYFQTNNMALRHFIDQIVLMNNVEGKMYYISDFNEIKITLDNILMHNFDTKGELLDYGQQSSREIYNCLLDPNGVLLPEKIFLVGQLVYSEQLPKAVYVNDENIQDNNIISKDNEMSITLPEKQSNSLIETNNKRDGEEYIFSIAESINKFKINQIFDLNSSLYTSDTCSDTRILIEMDDSDFKEHVINFGKIEKNQIPNALVIWYKIILTNDISRETKRNNSFMNHSAIVLEEEIKHKIKNNEDIRIQILQMQDLVRIKII